MKNNIERFFDEVWDEVCGEVEALETEFAPLKERSEKLNAAQSHLSDLKAITEEIEALVGDALEHLKCLDDNRLHLWFRKRIMEFLGFEGVHVTDGVKLTLKSGRKVLVGQSHRADLSLVGTAPTIHISDDGITLKESDNGSGNGGNGNGCGMEVPDYYLPSNGSEGSEFTNKYCDRCDRSPIDPDSQNQCDILVDALSGIQRPEWVEINSKPTCTAFVERPEIDGDAIADLEESRCSSCAKHPQFGGDCQILTEMKATQKRVPDIQKTDDVWFCSSYDHLNIEDEDDDIEEDDIESVYPHPVGSDLEGATAKVEDEGWPDETWPGPEPEPEPESKSKPESEPEPEPEPEFTPGNDPRTKYRELRKANRNILLNSKSLTLNKDKPADEESEGVPVYRSGDRVEFPKDSGAAPGLGKLEPALKPRQQLTREQRKIDKEINDYAWSLLPIYCSAISVNLVLKKYPHGMDSLRRGESLYRRFKLRNWDGSDGEECIQWDSPKIPTPVIVKPSAEDVHDRIEREKREKWESLTLPTAVDVLVKFRLRLEEAQKAGKKNISWKQFINDWDNCDEGPVGDRVFECLKFLREKRRLHFNDGGRTIKGGEWYGLDIPTDHLPPELMTVKWRDPDAPTEETPTEETSTEETSTEETSTEETSTEETSVKPKLKAGDIVRYLDADYQIVIIDYANRAKIEPISGGKSRRVPVAYLKPKTSDTFVK